jgi:hypothetical protein
LRWWFSERSETLGGGKTEYDFTACSSRFTGVGTKLVGGRETKAAEAFGGDVSDFLRHAHPNLRPPPDGDARFLDDGVSTKFDTLLRDMLVYEPTERPLTGDLLARDLFQ